MSRQATKDDMRQAFRQLKRELTLSMIILWLLLIAGAFLIRIG